jgi:hypothetical protein
MRFLCAANFLDFWEGYEVFVSASKSIFKRGFMGFFSWASMPSNIAETRHLIPHFSVSVQT